MILSPEQLELAGARVLMRVDFNVPLDKETLLPTDLTRIRAALPTMEYVLNAGASLVLCSHLGRPQGAAEDRFSLRHVVSSLESVLNRKVRFVSDCISKEALRHLQTYSLVRYSCWKMCAFMQEKNPETRNLRLNWLSTEIVILTTPSVPPTGNMPQLPP